MSKRPGEYGNVRRVGHDINWRWYSVCSLIDLTSGLWSFAHNASVDPTNSGFHNQLDILEIGVGCKDGRSGGDPADPARGSDFCVTDESDLRSLNAARAHFGMWAMVKASLILGMDLEQISAAELAIIKNVDAISIDQDPLGVQGRRIASVPPPVPSATAAPSPICSAEGTVVKGGSSIPCDNTITVAKCSSASTTQRWTYEGSTGRFVTKDSKGLEWCMVARHGKLASLNDLQQGGLTIPWVEEGAIHAVPCGSIGPNTSCGQSDWCRDCSDYSVGAGCGSLFNLTTIPTSTNHLKNGTARISGWGGSLGVNNDWGASGPVPHTRHTCLGCSTGGQPPRDRQVFGWVMGSKDTNGASVFRLQATDMIKDDDAIGTVNLNVSGSEWCLDVAPAGQLETWMAPLTGGRISVALFNRSPNDAAMSVTWKQLGLDATAGMSIKSVWKNTTVTATGSYHDTAVPAHGMALLILTPTAEPQGQDEKECNVMTFGAKGDNTTEDTAAVQAAIDACAGTYSGQSICHHGPSFHPCRSAYS